MLSVHTARIDYPGLDRLDVTRKSGDAFGLIFAPSANLVYTYVQLRKIQKGLPAQKFEAFTRSYLAEMRQSWKQHQAQWDELLARPEATLVCYCADAAQCHRSILGKTILPSLGAIYEGERQGSLF